VAGRRILVEGREVESTAREFDLILFLHSHPGTVFSREQLMQQVWGPNHFGTVRTVDNFIARLRAKIEDDPDNPKHIETVRGVGYRFNP
jgi:DNA-binding response OmpR family regulator